MDGTTALFSAYQLICSTLQYVSRTICLCAVDTVLDCVFVQCFAYCLPMLHAIYDHDAFHELMLC